MRLPSAFETIVAGTALAMETCLWIALATVTGFAQPPWLLFGLPFACAVATRLRWFVLVPASAALAIYLHPAAHVAGFQNLLALALALRGAILGRRFTSVGEIRGWIVGGLLIFIALGTLAWPATGVEPLQSRLAGLVGGFVALGVLAAVMLQRSEVETSALGRRTTPKLGWIAAVVAPFVAMLAVAAALAGGGPAVFAAVLAVFQRIGSVVWAIVSAPWLALETLLRWLESLVPKGHAGNDSFTLGSWKFATPPPRAAAPAVSVVHVDAAATLGFAASIVLLAALAFVLFWMQTRLRAPAGFAEERSSLWSWSRLRDDLRRAFARRHAPHGAPRERPALPAVREIYRATLEGLAGHGLTRRPAQTPAEFLAEAAGIRAPVREPLGRLTAMYELVRYGERDGDEAAALRLAGEIAALIAEEPSLG